jgi:SIR2-like domain
MPTPVDRLVADLLPEKTVLLFGAGSSHPSGAPSSSRIIEHLSKVGHIAADGFSLAEFSLIFERETSRRRLIDEVRSLFRGVHPTGSLLNISLYNWKNIYTTNYDELIEESYKRRSTPLVVYSSNFDFGIHGSPGATKLFKLHGTISSDICDGSHSRIVLTESDYDVTEDYREQLYTHFKADLIGANLVIVGHSLTDPDIKTLINRAISINQKTHQPGRITLLLYTRDDARASLFEQRGLRVCFGGMDDLFLALARQATSAVPVYTSSGDPFDSTPVLRTITIDASHASNPARADVSAMFNGWPATYADIGAGLTFPRTVAEQMQGYFRATEPLCIAAILGASGVGKTTAARQTIHRILQHGDGGWEHKGDHTLLPTEWTNVASRLRTDGKFGVLFIDDAHHHLREINELVDLLMADKNFHLQLLVASTKNHWNPRIKTPNIFKHGQIFSLSKLQDEEITGLLTLAETNPRIRPLVEEGFAGFSRSERRRRLVDRCAADMFVCLKNIFASENFDDIILREYAALQPNYQDIYRYVAAMESVGVRVHRQLVIRLLGIPMGAISAVLENLDEIVHEYTVSEREGVYGWNTRHIVIANIIMQYKFSEADRVADLLSHVIDNLMPTYEIEIRTIRELCNLDTGIARITDRRVQNKLLRKMISSAPGERVPRHRLIRNLIEMDEFEKAETEIRLFDNDFGADGPVQRYKIGLLVARASRTQGLMEEDRIVILERAHQSAIVGVARYENNKNMLAAYCDVGMEMYRRTGNPGVFDAAMAEMKRAETRVGDPDITRLILRYERRFAGQPITTAAAAAVESD